MRRNKIWVSWRCFFLAGDKRKRWRCWLLYRQCIVSPDIRIGRRPVPTRTLSGIFGYLNIWNIWHTLSGILIWFLHLILQSVFQPTFRVQRLSFAFLRETKRSSEMNVSSSTWSQRQQRQRWKRWQEILYKNIRPMPLTVIMWLSLPRTQDTDLSKKEKLSFCCF